MRRQGPRAGVRPIVEEVHSTPWSSVTFSGARHRFSLRFDGDHAGEYVLALADGLDYAEFDLGAYILVDIAIAESRTDGEHSSLTIEALTIAND
jgi:hydrogenase maturation factor